MIYFINYDTCKNVPKKIIKDANYEENLKCKAKESAFG